MSLNQVPTMICIYMSNLFISYNKVQVLEGGKGRIMDDYASVHYSVRYHAIYIQPTVGDKIYGVI